MTVHVTFISVDQTQCEILQHILYRGTKSCRSREATRTDLGLWPHRFAPTVRATAASARQHPVSLSYNL